MPLDPSIPLQGRPVELQNPLAMLSTLAQLQGVREQTALRREAAEEARRKRTREDAYEQALQSALTLDPVTGEPTVDYPKLLGNVPASVVFDVQKAVGEHTKRMADLQTSNLSLEQKKAEYLGGLARSVVAAQYHPTAFGVAITTARKAGALTAAQADDILAAAEQDPAQIKVFTDGAVAQVTEPAKPEAFTLNPGDVRFSPSGQVIARGEPKPVEHSPAWKEWQDYQSTGGTLGFDAYQDREANRHKAVTHINTGQATDADVDAFLDGVEEGTLPPLMPGRASPLYTKIMGRAQRRGLDLAGRITDWSATQKHVATMNGAQQLRLNQAVNALPEMLDSVEALAKQWRAGRFPALNRAQLALAKGGALGPEAAAIANQLDAQIADVVADLGNVYMGGNSPTDHALSLAGKSLSADWSEPVLLKMVALAKKNVQIRRNSIQSTGVAGASEGNPYDNPTPTPPVPPPPVSTAPTEGERRPIPNVPGGVAEFRGGKWIRVQ